MPSLSRLPTRRGPSKKLIKVFDPRVFLTNAGIGRILREYGPKQAIFSQGEPADAMFFIQKGTVKLSVRSLLTQEDYFRFWDKIANLSRRLDAL